MEGLTCESVSSNSRKSPDINLALFQFIYFKFCCFQIGWPEESFEKRKNLNLMNVGYFGLKLDLIISL